MTDEQVKALCNVILDGFNRTIESVCKHGNDHDLLIRIDAKLDYYAEQMAANQKEFLEHKTESVSVRDAVKSCSAHQKGCETEGHAIKIQAHENFICATKWALGVIYIAIVGLIVRSFKIGG